MTQATWRKIKAIYRDLKIPDETYKTWKKRGFVPARRYVKLLSAAKRKGIELSFEELIK